jgi:hypothetical protein
MLLFNIQTRTKTIWPHMYTNHLLLLLSILALIILAAYLWPLPSCFSFSSVCQFSPDEEVIRYSGSNAVDLGPANYCEWRHDIVSCSSMRPCPTASTFYANLSNFSLTFTCVSLLSFFMSRSIVCFLSQPVHYNHTARLLFGWCFGKGHY